MFPVIESGAVGMYKIRNRRTEPSPATYRIFPLVEQPDNLVLELLRGMRTDLGDVKADVKSLRAEMKSLREEVASDMKSLRADVASDLLNMQKETREQIVGVRRALIEYHSSVVGHGMQISELQDRVRRLEQHLNLPPLGAH